MKILSFDSTLRDGAQSEGISFSVSDKIKIAKLLDKLNINFIEGGTPASNQKDKSFFDQMKTIKLKNSKLVAFSPTRKKGCLVSQDKAIMSLLDAGTDCVSIVGKSSVFQVENILKTSTHENLSMIFDTIAFLKQNNKYVIFDAEHFFDGFKENKSYAIETLETAISAGADVITLCDTNGGTLCKDIGEIIFFVKTKFPSTQIGIHCHNDISLGVANTITAVENGATLIQGTLLGIGERCGNANLSSIIPTLELKMNYDVIGKDYLKKLSAISHSVAETCNTTVDNYSAYIGNSAFAHKGGMHSDGIIKNTTSFEHTNPEFVGNTRRILLSEVAGKAAIIEKIKGVLPGKDVDIQTVENILSEIKRREFYGYAFEGADASFELLIKKIIGVFKPSFKLINLETVNYQPERNGLGAIAKLSIIANGNQIFTEEGSSDGPVHAIDLAIRSALANVYPIVKNISLVDYKVRVLGSGMATASRVRVLITSSDGVSFWTTVGVSTDIIKASFIAIADSIDFYINR